MSTAPDLQQLYTPEEYLARERIADHKSEFYRGRIQAMAGANARHNLICTNLTAVCVPVLRAKGCKYFSTDMKVFVDSTGLYTYSDGAIVCGGTQFLDPHHDILVNPFILLEVLSKSTETRDRGWKFQNYWNIPSLVDYVLVSQEAPLVEQFIRKSDDIWTFRRYSGLDSVLEFSAVACQVPLREIYFDVQFGPEDANV